MRTLLLLNLKNYTYPVHGAWSLSLSRSLSIPSASGYLVMKKKDFHLDIQQVKLLNIQKLIFSKNVRDILLLDFDWYTT